MNSITTKLDNNNLTTVNLGTIFRPSYTTQILSHLTAPKTIVALSGIASTALLGFATPICLIAGGGAVAIQSLFKNIVSGGTTIRAAVFTEAEHLSRMTIQGGLPYLTIPPMLEALEKMHSPNAVIARNCLKSVLEYENHFDLIGINNHFLVNDLIKKISTLQPKQTLGISLSWMKILGGHIIMGSIERKKNMKFTLRIHNGGDGCEFNYTKLHKSGRELTQTTLEIDEIALPELIEFIKFASTLHTFRSGHNSEKLYEAMGQLKGQVLPPSSDPRLWMPTQTGNSCSGYSFKCFLKSILSKDEFREYEVIFLGNAVDQLKNRLQNGWFWEKTEEHQKAYTDLSLKLMSLTQKKIASDIHVLPSRLSRLASKIQKKFWGFVFPLDFGSVYSLKLEMNYTDYLTIGELAYFKKLNESAEFIDSPFLYIDKEDTVKKANAFRDVFRVYFNDIDRTCYSKEELKSLDKIANTFLKTENYGSWSLSLQIFYKIVFPKKINTPKKDPEAIRLLNFLNLLKDEKFDQARTILTEIYQNISGSTNQWNVKNLEEFKFACCQTLDLDNSLTLNDIELRAGVAILFEKMGIKVPRYLSKNLYFYNKLSLDKIFPNSPWRSTIRDYYLEIARKKAEYILASDSKVTPRALKTIESYGGTRAF